MVRLVSLDKAWSSQPAGPPLPGGLVHWTGRGGQDRARVVWMDSPCGIGQVDRWPVDSGRHRQGTSALLRERNAASQHARRCRLARSAGMACRDRGYRRCLLGSESIGCDDRRASSGGSAFDDATSEGEIDHNHNSLRTADSCEPVRYGNIGQTRRPVCAGLDQRQGPDRRQPATARAGGRWAAWLDAVYRDRPLLAPRQALDNQQDHRPGCWGYSASSSER